MFSSSEPSCASRDIVNLICWLEEETTSTLPIAEEITATFTMQRLSIHLIRACFLGSVAAVEFLVARHGGMELIATNIDLAACAIISACQGMSLPDTACLDVTLSADGHDDDYYLRSVLARRDDSSHVSMVRWLFSGQCGAILLRNMPAITNHIRCHFPDGIYHLLCGACQKMDFEIPTFVQQMGWTAVEVVGSQILCAVVGCATGQCHEDSDSHPLACRGVSANEATRRVRYLQHMISTFGLNPRSDLRGVQRAICEIKFQDTQMIEWFLDVAQPARAKFVSRVDMMYSAFYHGDLGLIKFLVERFHLSGDEMLGPSGQLLQASLCTSDPSRVDILAYFVKGGFISDADLKAVTNGWCPEALCIRDVNCPSELALLRLLVMNVPLFVQEITDITVDLPSRQLWERHWDRFFEHAVVASDLAMQTFLVNSWPDLLHDVSPHLALINKIKEDSQVMIKPASKWAWIEEGEVSS